MKDIHYVLLESSWLACPSLQVISGHFTCTLRIFHERDTVLWTIVAFISEHMAISITGKLCILWLAPLQPPVLTYTTPVPGHLHAAYKILQAEKKIRFCVPVKLHSTWLSVPGIFLLNIMPSGFIHNVNKKISFSLIIYMLHVSSSIHHWWKFVSFYVLMLVKYDAKTLQVPSPKFHFPWTYAW